MCCEISTETWRVGGTILLDSTMLLSETRSIWYACQEDEQEQGYLHPHPCGIPLMNNTNNAKGSCTNQQGVTHFFDCHAVMAIAQCMPVVAIASCAGSVYLADPPLHWTKHP